ncbi:MAG: hypothetical protein JWM34_1690 [Ilumatobacteraceae bacterium]|nr:hypothetical protein [Ilumatobacteraceae bacterium]
MTRLLQRPSFEESPVDVPAPPSWDSVALAAYELGFAKGESTGRDGGRLDQLFVDGRVDQCLAAIDAAADEMTRRVLEVSELFVATVLRHLPEARTAGLLLRLGEVLTAFDPGSLVLSVNPDDLDAASESMARRPPNGHTVSIVGDRHLATGEFRLTSDWASADGTFDRYLDAAREALELHLSADPR